MICVNFYEVIFLWGVNNFIAKTNGSFFNWKSVLREPPMQHLEDESAFSRIPWSSQITHNSSSNRNSNSNNNNSSRVRGQRTFASTTTGYSSGSGSNSSFGTAWQQQETCPSCPPQPRRFSIRQPFRYLRDQNSFSADNRGFESDFPRISVVSDLRDLGGYHHQRNNNNNNNNVERFHFENSPKRTVGHKSKISCILKISETLNTVSYKVWRDFLVRFFWAIYLLCLCFIKKQVHYGMKLILKPFWAIFSQ